MTRAMKDSGIEWIGEIPESWKIGKIGQLYSERKEKVSDKDYEPLSVTMQGILPQLSTAAKSDAHDDRKLVKKGDFAINSRSDRRGSCGISDRDGSVSLINTILCPRNEMNPIYYNWLFHSTMFADEFYKWGHGIVDDLWTTNWSEMKSICIPIPNLSEQQKIAAFLDKKCSEIDAILTKTKESIEEYKLLKNAIITQSVTKGIRPDRKMKNSGCDWIESIPEDWDIKPLTTLFNFGKGLPITKEDLRETGIPVLSYGQIHSKTNSGTKIQPELLKFVDDTYLSSHPQSLVHEGDFIFADTSEDLDGCGNCSYVNSEMKLFAGYHTVILKAKEKNIHTYLAYLFKTDIWRKQIREWLVEVKVYSVSRKALKRTSLIFPPITEQIEIANYLDEKTSVIDTLINKKEQLITELEIYKKSLIYEYVTGKKEVK